MARYLCSMIATSAHMYVTGRFGRRRYGAVIRREVAEAVRGSTFTVDREFSDWVGDHVDRMMAAVDRRRLAGETVRGKWVEIEAADLAD